MTDVVFPQPMPPFRWRLAAFNDLLVTALWFLLLVFCWSAAAVVADSVQCRRTTGAFSSGFNAGFEFHDTNAKCTGLNRATVNLYHRTPHVFMAA
jgi:hypothetical protein